MTDREQKPMPWIKYGLIAAGLAGALATCTHWGRQGFSRMLAFTTADTEALRRLTPDLTKPTFRVTLKTDVVHSESCPEGVNFCTYDRLIGEKDTIQLPRSITYEFPTRIISGVNKDGSGIYLKFWHRSFDPTFGGDMPPDTLMVLNAKGEPTGERWIDRQERNKKSETDIQVSLRNFYYSESRLRHHTFGPLRDEPTCDIEQRDARTFIYRHKAGFDPRLRNDPAIRAKICPWMSDSTADAYKIRITDHDHNVKYMITCSDLKSVCHMSYNHENWQFSYRFSRSIANEPFETHQRIIDFVKSHIVARSYAVPTESAK